ncbi:hypothetical protein G6F32_015204 [Rhizopus arrhizus]|nr:hypothetical protein G6F32_015204 [Rhizopus arrhizus]
MQLHGTLLLGCVAINGIIHFMPGLQHGATELQRRLLLLQPAQCEVGLQPPALEDRQTDRRPDAEPVRVPAVQVIQLPGLETGIAIQGDARQEAGLSHADARRRRMQCRFGTADVRATFGQFAGHAHRHRRQRRPVTARVLQLCVQRLWRLCQQECQRIAQLRFAML